MNQRAVDVSPGIANMGSDDGATQKATQGFKTLEAHKTRWSRNQRELKTVAYLGEEIQMQGDKNGWPDSSGSDLSVFMVRALSFETRRA